MRTFLAYSSAIFVLRRGILFVGMIALLRDCLHTNVHSRHGWQVACIAFLYAKTKTIEKTTAETRNARSGKSRDA
jgi:hypothetical protein